MELEDEIWTVSQLRHQIKKKLRIFVSPLHIGQIMSKNDSFTKWSTTDIVGTFNVFQQFQPIIECLEMIRKKSNLSRCLLGQFLSGGNSIISKRDLTDDKSMDYANEVETCHQLC